MSNLFVTSGPRVNYRGLRSTGLPSGDCSCSHHIDSIWPLCCLPEIHIMHAQPSQLAIPGAASWVLHSKNTTIKHAVPKPMKNPQLVTEILWVAPKHGQCLIIKISSPFLLGQLVSGATLSLVIPSWHSRAWPCLCHSVISFLSAALPSIYHLLKWGNTVLQTQVAITEGYPKSKRLLLDSTLSRPFVPAKRQSPFFLPSFACSHSPQPGVSKRDKWYSVPGCQSQFSCQVLKRCHLSVSEPSRTSPLLLSPQGLTLATDSRADLWQTPKACQAQTVRVLYFLAWHWNSVSLNRVGHTHKHIHHTHISGQDCPRQCFGGLFIQGQTNSHFENINSVKAKVLIFGKLLCCPDVA